MRARSLARSPRFAIAVTVSSAIGLALLYACSSSSSSSEAVSCGSLASCCVSVPVAEQATCDTVASENDSGNCALLLASYSSECAGATTMSSASCTTLSLCCAGLPTSEETSSCVAAAATGLEAECAEDLSVFQEAGRCGDRVSDGGGSGDDGANGDEDGGDDGGTASSFEPGDGGACTSTVGSFPSPDCDPSDEMACGTSLAAGCTIDSKCGDPSTCEPFTTNPQPGTGVDSFRMRLLNITAPSSLGSGLIQSVLITESVDLPASLASCGEDGQGGLNWLLQVDQANHSVTTGGAPYSDDPFGAGYCFARTTVASASVAPITVAATFMGSTFKTSAASSTLNVPIFMMGGTSLVLPIGGATFDDVTISDGGNCIGAINNDSLTAQSSSASCTDLAPSGPDSCSRWHSAGAVGGFINLALADSSPLASLGGKSLCTILVGGSDPQNPDHCTSAARASGGNYCSTTRSPGGCDDSVWFSAQFAASAVVINSGAGVSLCGG